MKIKHNSFRYCGRQNQATTKRSEGKESPLSFPSKCREKALLTNLRALSHRVPDTTPSLARFSLLVLTPSLLSSERGKRKPCFLFRASAERKLCLRDYFSDGF